MMQTDITSKYLISTERNKEIIVDEQQADFRPLQR
jgi:hypothetical protein